MINTNIDALIELVKKPMDLIVEIKDTIVGVFDLYIEFCNVFPQPFDILIKILIPSILLILIVKLWEMIK